MTLLGGVGERMQRWRGRTAIRGLDWADRDKNPEKVLRRDQKALSRIVRLVGDDPKKTAVMRSRIAKNLEEMARFAEARPLREELIVLYQQQYGGESDEALAAEEILAVNLSKDEQWQEARNIWRRTFALRLRRNGPQDERTMRDAKWLDFVNQRLQSA